MQGLLAAPPCALGVLTLLKILLKIIETEKPGKQETVITHKENIAQGIPKYPVTANRGGNSDLWPRPKWGAASSS